MFVPLSQSATQNTWGSGTQYIVETPAGVLYCVIINGSLDVFSLKSLDGGLTWRAVGLIHAGTVTNLSVWFDRWSGIAGGLIHCAYTENVSHDVRYRTIDTENSDALSTETVVFNGASAATNQSMISVTRARGGNVYIRVCIDSGLEGGFFRLPNANVPNGAWDAARTINEALSGNDQMILLPGWAADNQDIIGIFLDNSASEISRQLYDDSANSWSETSIVTGITAVIAQNNTFPHFSAAVDITNNQNVLVAWNDVDGANADLLGWTVTESAITAFATPVVSNGADDQGLCAIGINATDNSWHVFYGGASDGSETWDTSFRFYRKVSTDAGATWGPESSVGVAADEYTGLFCTPRFIGIPAFLTFTVANSVMPTSVLFGKEIRFPRANLMLGV